MLVDFDVRGQQGMDFFSMEEVVLWIMEYYGYFG